MGTAASSAAGSAAAGTVSSTEERQRHSTAGSPAADSAPGKRPAQHAPAPLTSIYVESREEYEISMAIMQSRRDELMQAEYEARSSAAAIAAVTAALAALQAAAAAPPVDVKKTAEGAAGHAGERAAVRRGDTGGGHTRARQQGEQRQLPPRE
mmetsp:Transcript_48454/g.111236  ORF Transcript_48454/g.111236 Transcript_48454/m.111236 type:complete len:153 (+) Transcript_48454:78-536(+)